MVGQSATIGHGTNVGFFKRTWRSAKKYPAYRILALPRRALIGARSVAAPLPLYLSWLIASKEEGNFTYDLTEANLRYLAHTLAVVTGQRADEARVYIDELINDEDLKTYLLKRTRDSNFRGVADKRIGYAKRLGWYAIVRLIKPRIVVETGVDKGLGAVTLCRALMRNRDEGHDGRYIGTDIEPTAGWLLQKPYADVGEIRYGDSLTTLRKMTETIDLFINDSDHSAQYEADEYEAIQGKLSQEGVVLGDNAHVTSKLADFATRHDRAFLFFKEEPKGHWYPGAGIGFSFVHGAKA